jgi:signal transduction histidine kinase
MKPRFKRQSLRKFSRLDEAEIQKADIHEGIDSTLTLVHHELKNKVDVIKEYGDIPPINCYPNQLNQVFMNLIVNAAHAIEGKGHIRIKTFVDRKNLTIEISDTGKGIPPEDLKRIFDPGFTTKGVGVGTGLGLAISYRIVKDHNGKLEVESEVGKGTKLRVVLPIDGMEQIKS